MHFSAGNALQSAGLLLGSSSYAFLPSYESIKLQISLYWPMFAFKQSVSLYLYQATKAHSLIHVKKNKKANIGVQFDVKFGITA